MAGATFSRLKNWIAEVLTYADLNAEIDNVLTNLTPGGVDDMSANATAMRVTTSPGTAGSEALATSLAGEVERLRYVILRILGSNATYWYDAPGATLTNVASILSTSVANRIASGRVRASSYANSQPIFLVPQGTTASVILNATSTAFQYYVNNSVYNINSNVTLASLTTAPTTNNTCAVNLPGLAAQDWSKLVGEFGTSIPIDNIGTEITSLTGKIAAFKAGTEYFIAKVESARLSEIQRGFFFDNADAPLARTTLSDNDGLALMKLGWIYANTAGAIEVGYTNPSIGSQPGTAVTDDYWYDTANNTWKRFTSSTWGASNSHLIGMCVQNTTGCVAARSFDLSRAFLPTNGAKIKIQSNSVVMAQGVLSGINVYGIPLNFFPLNMTWDMASDLDAGVTEAASTMYFFYVKETGKTVISDVAPYDRTGDLLGLYHPHSAWRCVGQCYNDAASNLTALIDYSDTRDDNYRVTTQISGGALTIDVHGNPLSKMKLPSQNSADVAYPILCKQGITIPSTATMGHSSANAHPIHVSAVDGNGALLPAVSTYFQKQSIAVTAAAVSTGSDLNSGLYAIGAVTSVASVPLAYLLSTQASAGVYSTAVVDIKHWPFRPLRLKVKYNTALGNTCADNTATVLNYGTRVSDNYNSVIVGSTWNFRPPKPMSIQIKAHAHWAAGGGWTGGEISQLMIYTNGVVAENFYFSQIGNHAESVPQQLETTLELLPSDSVAVVAQQNTGGALGLILTATYNSVSILEVEENS